MLLDKRAGILPSFIESIIMKPACMNLFLLNNIRGLFLESTPQLPQHPSDEGYGQERLRQWYWPEHLW